MPSCSRTACASTERIQGRSSFSLTRSGCVTALIPRMRNTWALFNMQRNEVHAMEACIVEGGDDWSWYHAGGREQDSADDETIQQADVIHSAGVAFRSID